MKLSIVGRRDSSPSRSWRSSLWAAKDRKRLRLYFVWGSRRPSVSGPEEVVALAYVVDQPDSPIKIVSADFKNSFVSVANERFTEQLDCTLRVRNQSDRAVRSFSTITGVTQGDGRPFAGSGFGVTSDLPLGRSLMPGAELEVKGCGGRGDGGAPNNRVRLLVAIESVSLDGCLYVPSRRFAF